MYMATILIVEDDSVMSRLYQRIFSIEGHTVVIASDGEDAIPKAKECKPALVLLDIMMPKMNGFQVLEKLKHDPQTTGIPVVMLTNLAGTQEMENAMSHGAIKYLIKSELEPAHLTAIIREVLAGLPPASSVPAQANQTDTAPTTNTTDATVPAPKTPLASPAPSQQPPAQSSTEASDEKI